MFAIVDIAGFQEKVQEGDALVVPRLESEDGINVMFSKVFLVSNGDTLTFGSPLVSGASVAAKIVGEGRGEKIRVVKAHKRKRYRRVHGHRQDNMKIEILKINL